MSFARNNVNSIKCALRWGSNIVANIYLHTHTDQYTGISGFRHFHHINLKRPLLFALFVYL